MIANNLRLIFHLYFLFKAFHKDADPSRPQKQKGGVMQKNQSTQYELLNSFAFKRKKNDKNNSFFGVAP